MLGKADARGEWVVRRGKRAVSGGTSSSGGIWALGGKNRSTTLPRAAREHPSPEPGIVPVEETSMK